MNRSWRQYLLLIVLTPVACATLAEAPTDGDGQPAFWALLGAGEAVALIRHALAPGTGDPPELRIEDCATQRNLSDGGRLQAQAIGERFRANGIAQARIYSSRWCRCLETARLLALGPVQPFDGLGSFFRNISDEPQRTSAVLALIRDQAVPGKPPLGLVTHQVNITALTGEVPESGEVVVVQPSERGVKVLGRLR